MVNQGCFFADYYFYLQLMLSSTIVRDINIISIERLLHSLLSGKPLISVLSASILNFLFFSQSWFILHQIYSKQSTTFRSRRLRRRIQTWCFSYSRKHWASNRLRSRPSVHISTSNFRANSSTVTTQRICQGTGPGSGE